MSLKTSILQAIKAEVLNDPEGLGYQGKTMAQIIDLINNPYYKTVTTQVQYHARINQILRGVADTPNSVTTQDVTDAQAS